MFAHFRPFPTPSLLRSPGLGLRQYHPGDDADIVALWNHAHRKLAGYIPRSLRLWRWSVRERPGVGVEDILLVEDRARRLFGYGAIERRGIVLDFVVDPDVSRRHRREASDLLIEGLEERARIAGAQALTLALPESARIEADAVRRAGCRTGEAESMSLSIIDPSGLLDAILKRRSPGLESLGGYRILLQLARGDCRFHPQNRVGIDVGQDPPASVRVTAEPHGFRPTFILEIDLSTLTDLIFRRAKVEDLERATAFRVHPSGASTDARHLLDLLVLRTPWHLPIPDVL